MIYWLFESFFFQAGLIIRIAGAAVVAFLVVMGLGPRVIRFLVKRKLGDRPEFDHADLNELTRHKSDTPTMGGILIVAAIGVSTLLWADLGNFYIRMGLLALLWLGSLGAVDDWMKLQAAPGSGNRYGLKSWEKSVFQIGLVILLSVFMRDYGSASTFGGINPAHRLQFPFWRGSIYLPMIAYVIVNILVMVGSSNAVNLSDGMDGLAAGCTTITAATFLLVSLAVGVPEWARNFHLAHVLGSKEMCILCSAIAGACIGFLWYNAAPAQVFMGDTGSLPLGGLIGFVAIVTRQEFLLLIAGGVFVMEAGSVVIQVGYFKWTKRGGKLQGKRVFRCAPIHYHFHLGGWAETKVVARFWILGLIFAALALATLRLR